MARDRPGFPPLPAPIHFSVGIFGDIWSMLIVRGMAALGKKTFGGVSVKPVWAFNLGIGSRMRKSFCLVSAFSYFLKLDCNL
jgi:hypothetical protein